MVASTRQQHIRLANAPMGGPGMRVVAYYRMSSDEQTNSIAQQQREVRAFAKGKGWVIVREYVDAGKSGSKNSHKRVAFHQMIADSANGEWVAVLCWDTSRFTRQDSLDAASYKNTLRKNGVHLETVTEGRIDWNRFEDRFMDQFKTEQNNDYAVKISTNSVRGRNETALEGWWPHGTIPFGFDRQYFENGKPVARLPRNQRPSRSAGSKLKLVPNEADAAVVRWLFEQFTTRDLSLRQLAFELMQKGVARPKGGKGTWNKDTVKDVLLHPAYVGDTSVGHSRRWKDYTFMKTCEQTIVPDTHPAIIDRATWARAQSKLAKMKATGRRTHSTKASPLSGVLVCGHCGHKLDKKPVKKNGKTLFVCSSPNKRPHLSCRQRTAHESELLPVVCRELVQAIDFEVLKAIQAKPDPRAAAELTGLKVRARELQSDVATMAKNLARADASVFDLLQADLIATKAELEKVQNTITLAESEASDDQRNSWAKWWKATKKTLVAVPGPETAFARFSDPNAASPEADLEKLMDPNLPEHTLSFTDEGNSHQATVYTQPDVLRDLLHRLNCRLHLHWLPRGERYFKLDTGRLTAEFDDHSLEVGTPTRTPHRSSPAPAN